VRLMSFSAAGVTSWGIVVDDHVVDLSHFGPDLKSFLSHEKPIPSDLRPFPRRALIDVMSLPPIPWPDKILCTGLNYLTHTLEGGRKPSEKPTIFTRFANMQTGHLQPIIRPAASNNLDFEGELAVIIGQSCRHVAKADAYGVIAGYSCYNDGSVRDWQRHSSQFTAGKNFPQTGGFGP
jgi:2-keto-4-pentenoate hydratase/2-oxohepta-3-ene-1,7-dioic acid hydratase in catechol pathway